MAYYKRKYNARKRFNRKLSTRRIFGNRSAKSQANQIYSLNKKVNRIYKKTRPETKVLTGVSATYTYSSSAFSSSYQTYYILPPASGSGDNERVGDKIYYKSVSLGLYAEYYNDSNTGYHDSESSGCVVRVLGLKRKRPAIFNDTVGITDVLSNASGTGSDYTLLCETPFKTGITQNYRIVCDKKFNLTSNRNQFHTRVYAKRPGLCRFQDTNVYNGFIWFIIVSGLHYDENFKEYAKITVSSKQVYTDN